MRYVVKAKFDNPPAFGERVFQKDGKPLAKGDEMEISGAWFETVNGRQYLDISGGGAFELVRMVPEYDHERRFVEREEERLRLESLNKDALLKEAKKLKVTVPASAKKEEILETVETASLRTEEAATTGTTEINTSGNAANTVSATTSANTANATSGTSGKGSKK